MMIKYFKKNCIIMILFLCVFALLNQSTFAYADTDTTVTTNIKKVLDDYTNIRQMSFYDESNSIVANSLSSNVLVDEKLRKTKIKQMEKKLNINIVSAKSTYNIKSVQYIDENVLIGLYEWTYFDYLGEKGLIDTSGYGIDHDILISLDENKNAKLLEDAYNEGPLTDMYSSTYKKNKIVDNDNVITDSRESQQISQNNKITPSSLTGYYATYNPASAHCQVSCLI